MAANHYVANGDQRHPQSYPYHHQPPIHAGTKRHAEDDLDRQSNISTQFRKLRINNAHHAIPLQNNIQAILPPQLSHYNTPSLSDPAYQTEPSNPPRLPTPLPTSDPEYPLPGIHPHPNPQPPPSDPNPPTLSSTDFMPIDTHTDPHKIYIPSLAAELASIEACETNSSSTTSSSSHNLPSHQSQSADPHTFYIPSHFSKIPSHVLRPNLTPRPQNQLVLYKEPSSISVPEAEDAVRKAIVEARRRARERQARERENNGREGGGGRMGGELAGGDEGERSRGPAGAEGVSATPGPVVVDRDRGLRWEGPGDGFGHNHAPNHYSMEDGEDEEFDADAMDLG